MIIIEEITWESKSNASLVSGCAELEPSLDKLLCRYISNGGHASCMQVPERKAKQEQGPYACQQAKHST